jgi:hypothetical protein
MQDKKFIYNGCHKPIAVQNRQIIFIAYAKPKNQNCNYDENQKIQI